MVGFLKSVAGAQNSLANVGKGGGGGLTSQPVIGFATGTPASTSPYTATADLAALDVQPGDVLIAVLIARTSYSAETEITANGWTELDRVDAVSSNVGLVIYTKTATGSETTVSADFVRNGGLFICVLRGYSTPVEAEAVIVDTTANTDFTISALANTAFDNFFHFWASGAINDAATYKGGMPGNFVGEFLPDQGAIGTIAGGVFLDATAGGSISMRSRDNPIVYFLTRIGMNRSA